MQSGPDHQQQAPRQDQSRLSTHYPPPPTSASLSFKSENEFFRQSLPPRTLEPHNAQHGPSPYLSSTTLETEQDRQRPQLPGLHELLSPGPRPETTSPGRYASTGASTSQGPQSGSHFTRPPMPVVASDVPPTSTTYVPRAHHAMPSHPYRSSPHSAHHFSQTSLPARSLSQYMPQPHLQHHPSAMDERGGMAHSHAMSAEAVQSEPRRDSARPGTSSTAGTPNCVGQRQIPGKGLCFVYKDGNTCPTVIDGELVNPLWGTTKAGKARKRLAQACLNCREKKIRCEPRHPRCVQCEKSKRTCQMPAAASTPGIEGSGSSSTTSTLPPLSPAPLSGGSEYQTALAPPAKRRRSTDASGVAPHIMQSDAQARPRHVTDPRSLLRDVEDADNVPGRQNVVEHLPLSAAKSSTLEEDPMAWDADPFDEQPEQTLRLLSAFFTQQMSMTHTLFPRAEFVQWVRQCRRKCQNERMVLYSLLALGSIYNGDSHPFAKACAERATQAVQAKSSKFSIALVQSRLFLSFYHHAKGRDSMGWDLSGASARALLAERLNTEEGCVTSNHETGLGRNLFALSNEQMIESKRRTFWAVLLLDQFSSFCTGHMGGIRSDQIFLRVPCSDASFVRSLPSQAPFFDNPILDPATVRLTREEDRTPRTYVLRALYIWSGVTAFITSGVYHNPSTYAQRYESFLAETESGLSDWSSSLSSDSRLTIANLHEARNQEHIGCLVSMHAIYSLTGLVATRHVHHALLSRVALQRNVRLACYHAQQILRIAKVLCTYGQYLPEDQGLHGMLSPLVASAIFLAIDCITAGGFIQDAEAILADVLDGFKILQVIGHVWTCARVLSKQTEKRAGELEELLHGSGSPRTAHVRRDQNTWRMEASMERIHEPHYDVMYGVNSQVFFEALQSNG